MVMFIFVLNKLTGTVQLPQDVLIHIFSFLDMPSLVSVELVSW